MIKAAIFDFNGTLFWDTHFHSRAFDIFVERYINGSDKGLRSRPLTEDDKRDNIMGQTNDSIMEFIFGQRLSAQQVAELGEEKEAIYRDLCRGKVAFAPGVEMLFDRLTLADIPFAVASSADKANIDFYFEQIDLARWFPRNRVVYNDGTFNGKPAPDIFLLAARRLGVKAEETVIFEDSMAGIKAAESAHADKVVIVDSNGYGADAMSKFGDRHPIITDFREAIGILGL